MLSELLNKCAAMFSPRSTGAVAATRPLNGPDTTSAQLSNHDGDRFAYIETLCRYWDVTIDIIQDHLKSAGQKAGPELKPADTAQRLRERSRAMAESDPIVALLCEWQAKLTEGTLTHGEILLAWWPQRGADGRPDLNQLAAWCREKLTDDPYRKNAGIDLDRVNWQVWAEVVHHSNAEAVVDALKLDD